MKILGTVLNNIFNFPNFLGIIFLSMKCLKKKQSQIKILQNLRILPPQNSLEIDFFCVSNFELTEF